MKTELKYLALDFDGEHAHAVSTFLLLFEQQFKENPTDAAHQLKRNLDLLVDSPRRKHQVLGMPSDNIVSLRDRRGNGLPRPVTTGRNWS